MSTLIMSAPQQKKELLLHQLNQLLKDVTANQKAADMTWTPAMEMPTTSTAVILRLELSGVAGKDVEVQVTRSAVLIAGDLATNQNQGHKPKSRKMAVRNPLRQIPSPHSPARTSREYSSADRT